MLCGRGVLADELVGEAELRVDVDQLAHHLDAFCPTQPLTLALQIPAQIGGRRLDVAKGIERLRGAARILALLHEAHRLARAAQGLQELPLAPTLWPRPPEERTRRQQRGVLRRLALPQLLRKAQALLQIRQQRLVSRRLLEEPALARGELHKQTAQP